LSGIWSHKFCNPFDLENRNKFVSVFDQNASRTTPFRKIERNDVDEALLNRLTPNDPYMVRTAPLTSKRCILYIYSTNIDTEYIKHALYSPFFLFKMQFVS